MTGEGVLEFSAGTMHELPKGGQEVSPLVKVSGHGMVTFAGTYLLLGRGVTVAVSLGPWCSSSTRFLDSLGKRNPAWCLHTYVRNTHCFLQKRGGTVASWYGKNG